MLLRKKNMADNSIQTATDGNFEAEVLTARNSQPVMVDFWAEWCRPCHMLAPTVAEIAHDYAGKLKVVKMNVDDNPKTPQRFGVRGIPNVKAFVDGKLADELQTTYTASASLNFKGLSSSTASRYSVSPPGSSVICT